MAIHFLCPFGHKLVVPDHRAGKKGRCPTCYQRVIVPVPNPMPSGKDKKDWDARPSAQPAPATVNPGQLGFFGAEGQPLQTAPAAQAQPQFVPQGFTGAVPTAQAYGAANPYAAAPVPVAPVAGGVPSAMPVAAPIPSDPMFAQLADGPPMNIPFVPVAPQAQYAPAPRPKTGP